MKTSAGRRRLKRPLRFSLRHIIVCAFLLFCLGVWGVRRPSTVARGADLVLGREPAQQLLSLPASKLLHRDEAMSRLELTHSFDIVGEVISVKSYRWSFTNPYYQVDLGLAWGPRVAEYKKKLRFYQGARWLMWSAQEALDEVTLNDIQSHIGNLHLIPAEGRNELDKAIHWMEKGDLVRVRGYLVRIFDGSGQVFAASSTTRDDTGNGACEIIWVEELQIGTKIYR